MTHEEINAAFLKANENEEFINLFENVDTPDEIDQLLKQYHIIETDQDAEKFVQLMNMAGGELDEKILESVTGGGASDFFNVFKWINDAAKEMWKGFKGCFNAGKKYQAWLNKHGLG